MAEDSPPTPAPAPAPAEKPAAAAVATPAASEIKPVEVAIVAGIAFAAIVTAFLVLCRHYYLDKYLGATDAAWARTKDIFFWSYATFAILTTASIATAVIWPRLVAHALTTVFGLTYLVSGVQAMFGPLPALVSAVQLVLGGGLLALTWFSYQKKDRAAWAFLASICVVLALVHLFGAPRVRTATKVELWYALTACGLFVGALVGFYRMRREVA